MSQNLYQALGTDYTFIQTEPIEEERLAMGWQNQEGKLPYLRLYYQEPQACQELIDQSDMVVFGGTDDERFIQTRLSKGDPVIRYSERLYKTGQWKAVSPRGLKQKYHDHIRYRKAPVYLLCSGGYVASDFQLIHSYPHKKLKWGYFPTATQLDVDKLVKEKIPASILWAGRMIDWKHPELPVLAAEQMKQDGMAFHLRMIGGGEMEEEIRQMIREKHLEDVITLSGFQKPEVVREAMENSQIYLFTSDYQEGWGAVLNESMNSGCGVVVSHAIGATPFLAQHGRNSLIFKSGDVKDLVKQTERLLTEDAFRDALGHAAYETILQTWNAENASKALLELAQSIRSGKEPAVRKDGPCSIARPIAPWRMYRYLMKHAEYERTQ